MSSRGLRIDIEAVDNASSEIKAVGVNLGQLSSALSDSERAQLASVAAAQQLRQAQQNLSSAVKTYGADSREAADALREFNNAQANVKSLQTELGESTRQTSLSMKDMTVALSGVATSAFSLYSAYDRVQDMQVSVDRANLQVSTSANSLNKSETALAAAIEKYGVNSDEAAQKTEDLKVAQERYQVAVANAEKYQGDMNDAIMQSALQVVPTAITMVDSLSRVWKNFPDMSALLTNLNTKIASVGSTAKIAALSVGALGAGFAIGSVIAEFTKGMSDVDRFLIGVAIPALTAAAVAAMVFWGALSAGTAIPIILGSIAVALPTMYSLISGGGSSEPVGFKTSEELRYPAYGSGAVVDSPVLAWVGEGGQQEIVSPTPLLRQVVREESGGRGGNVYNFDFTVQGNVDKSTADYIYRKIKGGIQ